MDGDRMTEDKMDTSGFYKSEGGQILFGPNFVLNAKYELHRESKDQYEYPVDGWYWFDSEEEAMSALMTEPK